LATFALVVPRRPASLQWPNRQRQAFQGYLAREASHVFAGQPLAGDLYVRVVWFYRRGVGDVDNILKPILDAIEGVVYTNDRSVVKCSSEKVDLRGAYELASDPGVASGVYLHLGRLLGNESLRHVTYIEVGSVPIRVAVFGPIDGGAL
jgi:hypothetical protein